MELTDEEKAIGDKAILKFEKTARNWRKRLLFLLIAGLAILGYGMIIFFEGFQLGLESSEDSTQRYMVEAEQLPSGTGRDVWMVGTFRKAAAILETRFGMYKIAVLETVLGLLVIFLGMTEISLTIIQWNKGPQKRLLAKLLRAKWEEEIG